MFKDEESQHEGSALITSLCDQLKKDGPTGIIDKYMDAATVDGVLYDDLIQQSQDIHDDDSGVDTENLHVDPVPPPIQYHLVNANKLHSTYEKPTISQDSLNFHHKQVVNVNTARSVIIALDKSCSWVYVKLFKQMPPHKFFQRIQQVSLRPIEAEKVFLQLSILTNLPEL